MKKYKNDRERGVALFFVVIALLLLTAIAAGIIFMSDTESGINANYRSEQQTYFASRAGLEEARVRIMPSPGAPQLGVADLTAFLPPGVPASTGAVAATDMIYITNPNASDGALGVQPWNVANKYMDDELCHENFKSPPYPANPGANIRCTPANNPPPNAVYYNSHGSTDPNTGTVSAMNYKWVRVQLKQNYSGAATTVDGVGIPASVIPGNAYTPICYDGFQEFLMNAADCPNSTAPDITAFGGKPVYVITSLAVNASGSRRMTQMEVANLPPIKTNAALDTQDFVNVGGSSTTVNGFDNCNCSCPIAKGNKVPTCTFYSPPAAPNTPCTGSTYAIFTEQSITTTGTPAIVAGTNPPTQQGVPANQFPWNIPNLAKAYANSAGTVIPSGLSCTGTPANCGTVSSGSFGTPPNPFPPTGAPVGEVPQITYFPGSVDLQAKGTGAGVMVVNGDLTVHGGFNFYGLVIVTGTLTFVGGGTGQGTNIIGGMLTGNGSVSDSLSGGVNIQFDSCALKQNSITEPPLILASHEVSY